MSEVGTVTKGITGYLINTLLDMGYFECELKKLNFNFKVSLLIYTFIFKIRQRLFVQEMHTRSDI